MLEQVRDTCDALELSNDSRESNPEVYSFHFEANQKTITISATAPSVARQKINTVFLNRQGVSTLIVSHNLHCPSLTFLKKLPVACHFLLFASGTAHCPSVCQMVCLIVLITL